MEESLYFRGAGTEAMDQHMDARLLADVARNLLDCALRPEECFRLPPENVAEGNIEIHFGKTSNARRHTWIRGPWRASLGPSDMNTTKRYIHPQGHTIRDAMQKAREIPGGHSFGHTAGNAPSEVSEQLPAIN